MSNDRITPTMRIQIALALAGSRNDLDGLQLLEVEARNLALNGAAIDAAKRGSSFDLLVDIALKFALAVEAGDNEASAVAKRRLAAFGVPEIAAELPDFVKGLKRQPGLNENHAITGSTTVEAMDCDQKKRV